MTQKHMLDMILETRSSSPDWCMSHMQRDAMCCCYVMRCVVSGAQSRSTFRPGGQRWSCTGCGESACGGQGTSLWTHNSNPSGGCSRFHCHCLSAPTADSAAGSMATAAAAAAVSRGLFMPWLHPSTQDIPVQCLSLLMPSWPPLPPCCFCALWHTTADDALQQLEHERLSCLRSVGHSLLLTNVQNQVPSHTCSDACCLAREVLPSTDLILPIVLPLRGTAPGLTGTRIVVVLCRPTICAPPRNPLAPPMCFTHVHMWDL